MEAYEHKSLRYTELAADAEHHGWKAKVCPVEVGCRGFVGKSTRFLKNMGIRGQAQRQSIKDLSNAAKQASRDSGLRGETPLGPQNSTDPTHIRGKNRWGHIWDAGSCQWAFWRCCGPIIETPVKEGTHLMTPIIFCPCPSQIHRSTTKVPTLYSLDGIIDHHRPLMTSQIHEK